MNHNELHQLLLSHFPKVEVAVGSQFIEMTVAPEGLHEVGKRLCEHHACRMDFLFCQSGVDVNGRLGVVYHVRSTTLKHACVLKCFAEQREGAVLDSVYDIWPAAYAFEREIYDLLGITFRHHPDLRRIFLEDDYRGFPLRKDFIDEINIIHN